MTKYKLETVLALIFVIGSVLFFFCAASGIFKGTDAIQTHITQIFSDILLIIIGFYWGNSKKNQSNDKPS